MKNISVEQAEKAAKMAEKFPWGTSIVVCLLSTMIVYWIMKAQIDYANARADKADSERSTLVNSILMKNDIIDSYRDTVYVQREIIQNADSTNKAVTQDMALGILNKKRRKK